MRSCHPSPTISPLGARQRRRRSGSDGWFPRPRSASSSARSRNRDSMARSYGPAVLCPRMRLPHAACGHRGSTSPTGSTRCRHSSPDCARQWALDLEQPVDTPHSLVSPPATSCSSCMRPSDVEAASRGGRTRGLGQGRRSAARRAATRRRRALLVERCVPGTRLWHADVDETHVVSRALPRLQVDVAGAEHRFPLLATEADRWNEELPRWYADGGQPFDMRLLEHALDVYRTVDRSATRFS